MNDEAWVFSPPQISRGEGNKTACRTGSFVCPFISVEAESQKISAREDTPTPFISFKMSYIILMLPLNRHSNEQKMNKQNNQMTCLQF